MHGSRGWGVNPGCRPKITWKEVDEAEMRHLKIRREMLSFEVNGKDSSVVRGRTVMIVMMMFVMFLLLLFCAYQ